MVTTPGLSRRGSTVFKKDTGSHVEFLLLEQKAEDTWEILVKPGKKAKMGVKYTFGDGLLEAEVVDHF